MRKRQMIMKLNDIEKSIERAKHKRLIEGCEINKKPYYVENTALLEYLYSKKIELIEQIEKIKK
jgi:hypothetical protein